MQYIVKMPRVCYDLMLVEAESEAAAIDAVRESQAMCGRDPVPEGTTAYPYVKPAAQSAGDRIKKRYED